MKITWKTARHRLCSLLADVALLLVFTFLWEEVNHYWEHLGELIGFSFLRMAVHNQLHSSAHQMMHALSHKVFHHTVIAKK